MHGLGNDFVIVDGRADAFSPSGDFIRWVCDRHVGVGGDQLLVIEPPTAPEAVARMRIYNVDGSEAQTCLNATRCVSSMLLGELRRLDPSRNPRRPDPRQRRRRRRGFASASGTALGLGEHSARLPGRHPRARPRVGTAGGTERRQSRQSASRLFRRGSRRRRRAASCLRPAERSPVAGGRQCGSCTVPGSRPARPRGVGTPRILTQACGSGACAAVLVARRRGLTDASCVTVEMPGGLLRVEIHDDESITLTGPVAVAFSGNFPANRKVS